MRARSAERRTNQRAERQGVEHDIAAGSSLRSAAQRCTAIVPTLSTACSRRATPKATATLRTKNDMLDQ
jgi:hypothetical protein